MECPYGSNDNCHKTASWCCHEFQIKQQVPSTKHSVFHKEKHSVNVIKNHLEEGLWKWIGKYIGHALEGEKPSIKRAQGIIYPYDFEKPSPFLRILFPITMFFLDLCLSSIVIPCLWAFSPWFCSFFFFWIWHNGKDEDLRELKWLYPCQSSSTTSMYPHLPNELPDNGKG